ncbi:MAG: TlpA family protein disulfide reductase [Zoogloeaceae bacterium]|nr:TlpA family protein disulfide reductase [Zoogloeaceae bacterium]
MKVVKVLAGALLGFVLLTVTARAEEEGVDALFSATMMDVHGAPMPLSSFRGKPLIVQFWARWCVPCRDEFPELTLLGKKYKKQGLIVLGIALEEDPVKVREFLAAYGVNYPAALAGNQGASLMQTLGNEKGLLPFTLLINRKGEVVLRKYGVFKKSDFQGVAGKMLR